ncbi:MAG: hypothetical protein U0U67_10755 [Chitinophagales bacterium]
MKSIFKNTLVFAYLLFFAMSFRYINPNSFFKKDTQFIYDVNHNGLQYALTLKITKVNDGFSFDWQTDKPLNKKGSVSIHDSAMQNANAIFSSFNQDKVELTNQTSIVISDKMFESWKGSSSMEIAPDATKSIKSIFGNGYNHTQNFEYKNNNSNELECRTVSDKDGYSITYLNDANFPIIVEMNLDWSIKLRKIVD